MHHRLVVVPRERHGDQRRVASHVSASPAVDARDDVDEFGNPVTTFFARKIEGRIEFKHFSVVTRCAGLEHRVAGNALDAPSLHRATPLTACDATLRETARRLQVEYSDPYELAEAINALVFREMRYEPDSTTPASTAASAFAQRAGVCQDYAHVMLALARHAGLAARYVSGHMIGEGGTHAWVEVLVPAGAAAQMLAFDPTHGRRVDLRYIVIAVGRDYADVAPTSGVFTAPFSGELTATKRVGATRVRYASPVAQTRSDATAS